jgi:hypothetical protein
MRVPVSPILTDSLSADPQMVIEQIVISRLPSSSEEKLD